jgi:hypothetical protein
MEWSNHQLTPYGVDPSKERLAGVTEVLPELKNNFALLKVTELEHLSSHGLPSQFDIVFWDVWANFDLLEQSTFCSFCF